MLFVIRDLGHSGGSEMTESIPDKQEKSKIFERDDSPQY